MNRRLIKWVIIVAIILEALWVLEPRKEGYPRSPETVLAEQTYKATPTAETEANYIAAIRRDVARNSRRRQIMVSVMLVADAALIYAFLNCGLKKAAA